MSQEDALQVSDSIMSALLRMFNSNTCKSGSVQEDALMAVSTLVVVLGEGFTKYMPAFKPFLFMGLKNHEAYQVSLLVNIFTRLYSYLYFLFTYLICFVGIELSFYLYRFAVLPSV